MDVDRSTFAASLPAVRSAVARASFVAIDLELTGLSRFPRGAIPDPSSASAPSSGSISPLDTPASLFPAIRDAGRHFGPTQFGLACFTWESGSGSGENSGFVVDCFNFSIFPAVDGMQCTGNVGSSTVLRLPAARCVLLQPDSLQFLAANGFDFNKWVRGGIPFLSRADEAYVRSRNSRLFGDAPVRSGKEEADAIVSSPVPAPAPRVYEDIVVTSTQDQQWMDALVAQISAWQADSDASQHLVLEPVNPYLRRLTYQAVRTHFPLVLAKSASMPGGRATVALTKFGSLADKTRWEEDEAQQPENELRTAVGFRQVIDLITQSKKPIVGHNCLLDLAHIIDSFVAPLAEDLDGFKAQVAGTFAQVYDTKLVIDQLSDSQDSPFFGAFRTSGSGLGDAFAVASNSNGPFRGACGSAAVTLSPASQAYLNASRAHEAGYDAYMTGVLAVRLFAMLHASSATMALSQDPTSARRSTSPPFSFESPRITRFANLLKFNGRVDICINLAGPDVVPDRARTLYVGNLTQSVRFQELSRVFGPFGRFKVSWHDDTSCFVTFFDVVPLDKVREAREACIADQSWSCAAFDSFARNKEFAEVSFPSPLVGQGAHKPSATSSDVAEELRSRKRQRTSGQSSFPEVPTLECNLM